MRHSPGAGVSPLPGVPGPRYPCAPPVLLSGAAGPGSKSSLLSRGALLAALPAAARVPSPPGGQPLTARGPRPTGRREGAQGLRSTRERVGGTLSPDNPRRSKLLPAGTSLRSDSGEEAVHGPSGKCSPTARQYTELDARWSTSPACNPTRPPQGAVSHRLLGNVVQNKELRRDGRPALLPTCISAAYVRVASHLCDVTRC